MQMFLDTQPGYTLAIFLRLFQIFQKYYFSRIFSSFISCCKFYDVHILVLIVKIEECTKKCTILKCKVFTIKTFGLRHVSNLSCGSSSGSVYRYLFKTQIINLKIGFIYSQSTFHTNIDKHYRRMTHSKWSKQAGVLEFQL